MSICFFIIIIIIVYSVIKLICIKKSIKEIKKQLSLILKTDTNSLLTISSADKDIVELADNLNKELKELRKQKLKYENGNQELKKIITNISHDMRTPLTAIKGYISLIKEDRNKAEYIKIVERKTDDLITLTNQLFDFSKTIDLENKLEKRLYCINELLEETIANYYVIFRNRDIVPVIEISKEKIYKNIDKNSIIRVFENILSNVTKYSNGDFKVKLDDNGKIIFSNNATSLDAITVQKIFDRYFTVENAKKSTGLGLAIAKQLVELNGGNINACYNEEKLIIEIDL